MKKKFRICLIALIILMAVGCGTKNNNGENNIKTKDLAITINGVKYEYPWNSAKIVENGFTSPSGNINKLLDTDVKPDSHKDIGLYTKSDKMMIKYHNYDKNTSKKAKYIEPNYLEITQGNSNEKIVGSLFSLPNGIKAGDNKSTILKKLGSPNSDEISNDRGRPFNYLRYEYRCNYDKVYYTYYISKDFDELYALHIDISKDYYKED